MSATENDDPRAAFIEAACVPPEGGHASGTLERAEALPAERPEIAGGDIYAAAITKRGLSIGAFGLFDSAAGGDAELHLDAAGANSVEAVVEVGDDAGVIGEDADPVSDAEGVTLFDARDAVLFRKALEAA